MSQSCNCEIPGRDVPIMGIKLALPESIFSDSGSSEPGVNTWESDWFSIAASGAYDFAHNLNLAAPGRSLPRIVARVKNASAYWPAGEIVFCDGCNHVGAISDSEFGWAISVADNSAHVSFGNYKSYMAIPRDGGCNSSALLKSDVECKLVITY